MAKFYVEVTNKPVISNQKINFGEFAALWEQRHNNKLSNTTKYRNTELLNNRILPVFYKKQLDKISSNDIVHFIETIRQVGMRKDSKDDKTLSDGSVQMHYKLLRSMFNKAVEWNYLSRNPCDLVSKDNIPKANYRRLPIWQEKDFKRFLKLVKNLENSVSNTKYKLMISLCVLTGARRGEFMSLTWNCVDFNNKRIYIDKACEAPPHQPVSLKSPKTFSSTRWLGIDDYTINLLYEYKNIQENYLSNKNLVNLKQFIFIERIHTSDTN